MGEYVFATILNSLTDTPVERGGLRVRNRYVMNTAYDLCRINPAPSDLALSTSAGRGPEEDAHLIFCDLTLVE
jgi:hypothetical protein